MLLVELKGKAFLESDPLTKSNIEWILQQLWSKSIALQEYLLSFSINYNTQMSTQPDVSDVDAKREELARRKSEAQKRAMEMMNKQAAKFNSDLNGKKSSILNDDVSKNSMDVDEEMQSCILCRFVDLINICVMLLIMCA
jgi:hypothetical protein